MNFVHIKIISGNLQITAKQVENTIELFDGGATIPFIARYRKEATNGLDEVAIGAIKEQNQKLIEIDKRRQTIINSIEEQGKLTDEIKHQLEASYILSELEDIYLPFKQKRKTKATIARENGLEPLAKIIMAQQERDIETKATKFLNNKVESTEAALQGARDIIAEWISESQSARNRIRNLFVREAVITSKVIKAKEEEAIKYKDYFNFEEPLKKCASHRLLAMLRGEQEGFLRINIEPSEETGIEILHQLYVKGRSDASEQVAIAVKDSYKRLICPSIETEFNNASKEKADEEAIRVFAENLRQLLLAPPLGQKRVLAIDPGFRTGCKVVCLDEQGNLLHNETIYPHAPQQDTALAMKKLISMVNAYKIEAISIGNGTASRETETFIGKVKFDRQLQVFMVSENGASIYSASPVAREEFPDYDITVRGAVSIGRRLMDPLAELVKIDAKSIGVGQYQHDVDQNKLKTSLDTVVESCVNKVGVNLNTSSKHLLTYVSGLGPQLAKNIVEYRKENGAFASRKEIKKVARMGDKAYEQCAGFLRITNATNPLDNTAVHPESYHIVEKMAKDCKCTVAELIENKELQSKISLQSYVNQTIGLPTLTDIMAELAKPGRDPRKTAKVFEFSNDVHRIEDLQVGMIIPGIVTNITNFGAFVDVGVKQDGLVHISNLKNEYVSNPTDVVSLHQHVHVKVIEVDIPRRRIQLSMKDLDLKSEG